MPVLPALRKQLAFLSLAALIGSLADGATVNGKAVQSSRSISSTQANPLVGNLRRDSKDEANPLVGNLQDDTKDGSSDQARAPLVTGEHPFESFGSPRYPDQSPELTWTDLAGHSRGKLGHVCEPGGPDRQCGGQLVCRLDVCRHCLSDRECPSLHTCLKTMSGENICVPEREKAWEKVGSDPWHFLCTVLIFFSSMLAAAAGTGGGGMFVPLLVFFAALKAESAVPLSQCMIFFSSLCNLVFFVAQRHTTFKDQPKIDYDCIVTFEPLLVLGVTFGVLLHRMSPQWFILVLLCITLGMALWRTAAKGFKQREEEKVSALKDQPMLSPREWVQGFDSRGYINDIIDITSPKSVHIAGIVLIWLLMFVASFHGLSACTWQFGVFFAGLGAMLFLCTIVATKCIITRTEKSAKPLDWKNPKQNIFGDFTYPAIAFGGGMLGGLLGLGGGVIMSPVLLEVGMHSESVQATTAVIVFLSSSLATIQFALLSQIVWHYALWYSLVTIVATLCGQHLCEVYVRRTGRYSFITLSIAGVLLFSLVALSIVGTQQVVEDVRYGQQMWWSTARLCSGGRLGILDVDVTPAQAWPSDMPGDGLPAM